MKWHSIFRLTNMDEHNQLFAFLKNLNQFNMNN